MAKLQAQCAALARHVNKLQAVRDENAGLRRGLADAQQQTRTLEEELSKKAALLRASQLQHRCAPRPLPAPAFQHGSIARSLAPKL